MGVVEEVGFLKGGAGGLMGKGCGEGGKGEGDGGGKYGDFAESADSVFGREADGVSGIVCFFFFFAAKRRC